MAFNSRDEMLDDLFEHIFGEEEVDDDDYEWFESKFNSWFDKLEGVKPPGKRRQRSSTPVAKPKRRPGRTDESKDTGKETSSGYGLGLFYGQKGA